MHHQTIHASFTTCFGMWNLSVAAGWEKYGDSRAFARVRFKLELTLDLLNDGVNCGQAQACAAANFLGRVERLKSVRSCLTGHTASRVTQGKGDKMLPSGTPIRSRSRLENIFGADEQLAAIGHCVTRVHDHAPHHGLVQEVTSNRLDEPVRAVLVAKPGGDATRAAAIRR